MATHSSILIWEIPWTEEPGGLQSMELQRVGHDQATNSAEFLKSFQTHCFIWCLQQPCFFRWGSQGPERLRDSSEVTQLAWRRAWQPTLVFLPGESCGQRSLVGYNPWGHKESHMTQRRTHTGHLWLCWVWLGSTGLECRLCVFTSAPCIFLFWHYWPHSLFF